MWKNRIITICRLSGTTKRTIIIDNILYLSLVVELFFYNHLMIAFRAVHHIVFFRFIWNYFIDQLSRCFFFVTEFCTFHQYIFFSMFCHFFCPWMDYMYKYTVLWLYIYIELGLRLKESIKWMRYFNLLSLVLRALVLFSRE